MAKPTTSVRLNSNPCDLTKKLLDDDFKADGKLNVQYKMAIPSGSAKYTTTTPIEFGGECWGHFKGKLSQELEVTTKFGGNDMKVNVKSNEIKAHVDYGNYCLGEGKCFNPYLALTFPRNASLFDTKKQTWAIGNRANFECKDTGVKGNSETEWAIKPDGNMGGYKNFFLAKKAFSFWFLSNYNFSQVKDNNKLDFGYNFAYNENGIQFHASYAHDNFDWKEGVVSGGLSYDLNNQISFGVSRVAPLHPEKDAKPEVYSLGAKYVHNKMMNFKGKIDCCKVVKLLANLNKTQGVVPGDLSLSTEFKTSEVKNAKFGLKYVHD